MHRALLSQLGKCQAATLGEVYTIEAAGSTFGWCSCAAVSPIPKQPKGFPGGSHYSGPRFSLRHLADLRSRRCWLDGEEDPGYTPSPSLPTIGLLVGIGRLTLWVEEGIEGGGI